MTFKFPTMVPYPKVQIDLRSPEEIARPHEREFDFWALFDNLMAEIEAEEAVWVEERRLRRLLHGDLPKPTVRNSHVDIDEDPYLAEDRALRAFEADDTEL